MRLVNAAFVWVTVSLTLSPAGGAIGQGQYRQPASTRLRPPPPPAPVPTAPSGVCLPYRGRVCAALQANWTVFVALPDTPAIVEERLRTALSVIEGSPDLTPECAEYALAAVCLAAFPPCDASAGTPRARHICRDECEHLRDALCKREYAIARAHPLIGQQIALPVCEQLPAVGTPAAAGCLRLRLAAVASPRPHQACFWGDGAGYAGTARLAASGRRCRAWSRAPSYARLAARQPALRGGHAFCRNWDGLRAEPWCFTAERGRPARPERCGLPRCAQPIIWFVIVPSAAFLSLSVLTAVICCLCRRARTESAEQNVTTKLTSTSAASTEPTPEPKPAESAQKQPPELIMDRIQLKEELGEGAFGTVFRGELAGAGPGGAPLPVAVKTLKDGAPARARLDFQRECRLMGELQHRHIVRLLGAVLRGQPQCLVFEHMSGGDLHEFLVQRSPRGGAAGGPPLAERQLVDLAVQVADGMAYLASHHYVHRDLAARNCLLDGDLTVKISDFGLSRDIYSSDYYRLQTKSLLPVRWMPAESILYGKFTTDSDIWSFGVLLWEIFSFGLQPYYGYSSAEVVDLVRRRQLLPRPEHAPAAAYQLMLDCWQQAPQRRPRFVQLAARLRGWQRAPPTGDGSASLPRPAPPPPPPGGRRLAGSELVLTRVGSTASLADSRVCPV